MTEGSVMPQYASANSVIHYEQALLGSLLVAPAFLTDLADKVSPDMFSDALNRAVFTAMLSMLDKNTPIDVITVAEYIEKKGGLHSKNILPYLGEMAEWVPSPDNAPHYAKNLIERALAKGNSEEFVKISNELTAASKEMITHGDFDIGSKISVIEQRLESIKEAGQKVNTFRHVKDAAQESLEEVERRFAGDGTPSGLLTGLTDLDDLLNGLQPADLVIVAGRPSMGKTALVVNACENMAMGGKIGGIVSLEMPSKALSMRMFSSIGRIKADDLRRGTLKDDDFDRLGMAVGKINGMKLYIDDRSTACLADIRSFARKIVAKEGRIDFLAIDYLQLMYEPSTGRGGHESRGAEITILSRGLKAIGKEFGIPIIALSQLNRSLEKRPDKRPIMSDLRESGAIEQDADVILFIYRDEVYNPDSADKGLAEAIIAKQRNGAIGTVPLNFENEYSKFSDRKRDNY